MCLKVKPFANICWTATVIIEAVLCLLSGIRNDTLFPTPDAAILPYRLTEVYLFRTFTRAHKELILNSYTLKRMLSYRFFKIPAFWAYICQPEIGKNTKSYNGN